MLQTALVASPARRRVDGLRALVTNTPLLAIRYDWRGLSPDVRFVGFEALPRVCAACYGAR